MNELVFDEVEWRAQCKQSVDNALIGSGQSETLFAQKLHHEINMQLLSLPFEHRANALQVACEFGYLNSKELNTDAQWNADHGYCSHGIELGFCPAGCEDDDEEEESVLDSNFNPDEHI